MRGNYHHRRHHLMIGSDCLLRQVSFLMKIREVVLTIRRHHYYPIGIEQLRAAFKGARHHAAVSALAERQQQQHLQELRFNYLQSLQGPVIPAPQEKGKEHSSTTAMSYTQAVATFIQAKVDVIVMIYNKNNQ